MIWLRSLAIWFLIIVVESIHGALRELFLTPRVGDETARRIGIPIGMVLILAVTLMTIKWIGSDRPTQLLAIGVIWSVLTIGFEALLGLWVLGYSGDRIMAEYDIRRGGLMGFGILFMTFAPLIAAVLRQVETE